MPDTLVTKKTFFFLPQWSREMMSTSKIITMEMLPIEQRKFVFLVLWHFTVCMYMYSPLNIVTYSSVSVTELWPHPCKCFPVKSSVCQIRSPPSQHIIFHVIYFFAILLVSSLLARKYWYADDKVVDIANVLTCFDPWPGVPSDCIPTMMVQIRVKTGLPIWTCHLVRGSYPKKSLHTSGWWNTTFYLP